ncbi:hypothetical protein [Chelatococcus reniformis]|uniref:Uncharacterized protein n=1 Tax=Chelatococcus reniformis TaxID=1494448 RepID=A0A916XAY9_9HYPH|nr:hypothetical protein [Chelatococcus reniformis]GGC58303.1 hypothetical protein GCM10010994_16560 [Chelatococcus reniformis]
MGDLPPAIDPTASPAVMPVSVARVDPATGRPTQALLNWEQALRNYTVKTVVDLQTRITTVSEESGDSAAKAEELIKAVTGEDGAYSAYILALRAATDGNTAAADEIIESITTTTGAYSGRLNTVEATANGGTAHGQVYLVAQAAPAGWTAAYGVELTAPGLYAGMQILVDTPTGTAAISLTANQLLMTDPSWNGGEPGNVFQYAGGVFRFLVPVRVGNQEIEDHAVTNSDADSGASPQSVTLDIRGTTSRICIIGTFDGSPSAGLGFSTLNILRLRIRDTAGTAVKDVPLVTTVTNVSGTNYANYYPTPIIYYAEGLAAGHHTYTIELYASTGTIPLGLTTDCSIIGIELSR